MMAEGGPPQYNKRPATVLSNVEVGRSSYMMRVKATDGELLEYQPGNVLAFEIRDSDEEWLKGPYTVSRCDPTEGTFDMCYRVVGNKSEIFKSAKIDDTNVQFGGKFKVPILEGVVADEVERFVGVSTGVGIGPLLGFAEQALSNDVNYKIDLLPHFRMEDDVCFRDTMDDLVKQYPGRFSWTPVLSKDRTDGQYLNTFFPRPVTDKTHFHLIGNGSLVNEWKAGLEKAGLASDRVTIEMYFNHKELPRDDVVDAIGEAMKVSVGEPAL